MATPSTPSDGQSTIPCDWRNRLVVATNGREFAECANAAARSLAGHSAFESITVISEPNEVSDFVLEHDAALLVTSIGEPCVLQRLLGDEFTFHMARATHTPTFAVAQGCIVPPRRTVVAIDFSGGSLYAARLAAAIAGHGELILVHVATPASRATSDGALNRCADGLRDGFSGQIRTIELTGDAATEILALANDLSADAIAVGTHGCAAVASGVIGPVATRIIRCSACSVLIAPWDIGHSPAPLHALPDGRGATIRRSS